MEITVIVTITIITFSPEKLKSNFCLLSDCRFDESLWRGIGLSYMYSRSQIDCVERFQ